MPPGPALAHQLLVVSGLSFCRLAFAENAAMHNTEQARSTDAAMASGRYSSRASALHRWWGVSPSALILGSHSPKRGRERRLTKASVEETRGSSMRRRWDRLRLLWRALVVCTWRSTTWGQRSLGTEERGVCNGAVAARLTGDSGGMLAQTGRRLGPVLSKRAFYANAHDGQRCPGQPISTRRVAA
jgi:hypothetical protein